MPLTLTSIIPFILLWLPTTLFFLIIIRKNKKITRQAKLFWSAVVIVTWFQGALVYAIWGLAVKIWDDLFREKSPTPTS
ncbi:MAG: hypothetical protein MUE54_02715 [Anaerolineae bacterium]|jgi:hypothetical protein|nr:hypothetical protein [Anaerolineae bacterium]